MTSGAETRWHGSATEGERVASAPRGRTSITLREMRADALHRLLVAPGIRARTVDDIPGLRALGAWPRRHIDVAIADLVHDGLLREDEHGRLHVEPGHS